VMLIVSLALLWVIAGYDNIGCLYNSLTAADNTRLV
jgi:hypothetical protein